MTTALTTPTLAIAISPAVYGPGFGWQVTATDKWGTRVPRRGKAKTEAGARRAAEKALAEEQARQAERDARRAETDRREEERVAATAAERAALLARAATVLDAMRLWQPIDGLEARFGAEHVHRECEALAMLGRLERSEGGYARVKPDAWTGD